ncbi:hypothetical protein [Actinomadura nitritigenes]|uniref:aromatic-ring hydroxylase C-terminal domain-containing protein n=1 Tax=Actinomadura nitritigenes TaxID=134602 RepID=UPI003D8FB55C
MRSPPPVSLPSRTSSLVPEPKDRIRPPRTKAALGSLRILQFARTPHEGLTGDFTTGYPNSPLYQGPTAGGRAPDARKDASTGRPVRLFDLQRGPHWTLLPSGDHATDLPQATLPLRAYRITTNPSATDPTTVIDNDGHTHRTHGGETALIRPDDYIAARCPTHAVRDVLARALARPPPADSQPRRIRRGRGRAGRQLNPADGPRMMRWMAERPTLYSPPKYASATPLST